MSTGASFRFTRVEALTLSARVRRECSLEIFRTPSLYRLLVVFLSLSL